MDLAQLHQKINEAHVHLGRMIERECQLIGEPFSSHLSAFLSAAMSVRGGFFYLQDRPRNTAIKAWREKWENESLNPEEKGLYEFMHVQRIAEVHIGSSARNAGSDLSVGQEEIKIGVGSSYSDKSGTLQAFGSPSVLLGVDTAVVTHKNTYSFTIEGKQWKATEACARYLTLLQRMVAQFEADYPSPDDFP